MYGDVRGCMVMYRDIWLCLAMYGDVYGCIVMYRSIWCCIGVYIQGHPTTVFWEMI